MRWGVSDRWRTADGRSEPTAISLAPKDVSSKQETNKFYEELVASKPALIDEKVKLHGQLIDEFNLALLDKISAEDLARQVKRFVSDHVLKERLPLNQKELEAFAE